MVGFAVASANLGSITGLRSSLGPGPPLDPGRRPWQFVTQGARAGLAPGRSRTEPVLFAVGYPVGIGEEWYQQLGQRGDGVSLLIGGEVDEGGLGQVDVRAARR
jgi:hypothetical protein